MGTLLTRIPLSREFICREKTQGRMSRKSARAAVVVVGFYNALVLSTLRQGKQLQLWDSNVHRITTHGYEHLRVPADYHI
jgi:hypothetical protein